MAKPPFNQLICTFSATPELHLVKGDTLVKQVTCPETLHYSTALHASAHFLYSALVMASAECDHLSEQGFPRMPCSPPDISRWVSKHI